MKKLFPKISAYGFLLLAMAIYSKVSWAQIPWLDGGVEQTWLASSKITSKGQASNAAKSVYGGKVLSVSQSQSDSGAKVFVVKILKQGKVIFVVVTEDGQTSTKS